MLHTYVRTKLFRYVRMYFAWAIGLQMPHYDWAMPRGRHIMAQMYVRTYAAEKTQTSITARRTDGQTGNRTHGRTDEQTDRQTDRRTDGQTDTPTDGQRGGQTDRRPSGQTDRRADGRTDGQTDRRREKRTLRQTIVAHSRSRVPHAATKR